MALWMMLPFSKNTGIKLSKKQTADFFKLLSELLKNGFSINESFNFMKKAKVFSTAILDFLMKEMENGEELTGSLVKLGINEEIITQIEFAQNHGNLAATLKGVEEHITTLQKQREHMTKILVYPGVLLAFLFSALIGMRQFLLPQLHASGLTSEENLGLQLINDSPYYISGLIGFFFIVGYGLRWFLNRKSAFERAVFFSRLPFFKPHYICYLSAFFALEWGRLFSQGMEIKQVVSTMKSLVNDSLMKELALVIEERLTEGETFYEQLDSFSFFADELSMIIQQGEIKGNLGKELLIYSKISREKFFSSIEKRLQLVQPVIFLVIALAVVGIYAAMLLPIYGGIEEL